MDFIDLRHASVAQLVEQRTENPRVVGSIPTGGTTTGVKVRLTVTAAAPFA